MITLELPPQVERQLINNAKETGVSTEQRIQELVLKYLEDLEDIRDAEAILKDIEEGRQKTTSLEDAMKEYELED